MTLFDADLPYVRRTETVKPNRYLGQTFSKAPILAQLDSDESVQAGIKNMVRRGTQAQRVLDHLRDHGPCTDDELIEALGTTSARPRRIGLTEKGLVVRVGTGVSKQGNDAALWGVR